MGTGNDARSTHVVADARCDGRRDDGDRSSFHGSEPLLFGSVDHVAIVTRDADLAIEHFRDRYGLPVVHDEQLDDVGVRLVYLRAGNIYLQVVQPTTNPDISEFLASSGEGLHHICFRVDDIEATLAGLPDEAGVEVFRGGRNRRACFLRDAPFGTRIELTEREEAEW